MSNKTLSKLKRDELLNLLYEQEKRIEELESKNKQLQAQLDDRHIRISKVGSIADASLALTNIFKETQKAADLYLANVQGIVREKQTDKYVFPAKMNEQPRPVAQAVQQPQAKPAVQPKPAVQKPAVQPKPVQAKPAAQKAVPVKLAAQPKTQEAKPAVKPAVLTKEVQASHGPKTVPQVRPVTEKPAYVGRHSKGGNGVKK